MTICNETLHVKQRSPDEKTVFFIERRLADSSHYPFEMVFSQFSVILNSQVTPSCETISVAAEKKKKKTWGKIALTNGRESFSSYMLLNKPCFLFFFLVGNYVAAAVGCQASHSHGISSG